MSEEKEQIDFLLEYLKNEENTRRIKTITITEAELLLNYIQQKENIIKEAKDFINGKDLKENEYRFAEDFNFAKLLEILDKGE